MMVMKRVGIAHAKAHLSEVVRDAAVAPIVIHNRGKDVAVVVGAEEYERLVDAAAARPTAGQRFLDTVNELKEQYGGGYEIPWEPIDFVLRNPFASPGGKRTKGKRTKRVEKR